MANRKLKSLKFPGIDDTYILDAGNVNYSDEETYEEGSVGEGLNALKEDFLDIVKVIDLSNYQNGYVNAISGRIVNSTDYCHVSGIVLRAGETVKITAKGYLNSCAMIAIDNGDNTYTSLEASTDNEIRQFEYTATEETNITLSFDVRTTHSAFILMPLVEEVENLKSETAYIIEKVELGDFTSSVDLTNYENGYINATSGRMVDDSSYCHVGGILLNAGETIKLTAKGYLTACAMISIDNGDNTYTPVVPSVDSTVRLYEYTAINNVTIVLCFDIRTPFSAEIYYNINDRITSNKNEIDAIKDADDFIRIFNNFGIVGDSLASGEIAYNDGTDHFVDRYDGSWLSIMCKSFGANPTHYSRGGMTTKEWVEDGGGYMSQLLADDAKNAYFIALGTNDKNQSYPIGNISDTSTASTFVGYYKKIIETITTKAPHAVIFMVSTYAIDGNNNAYNAMIEAISELYNNCYFVDYVNNSNIYTNNATYANMGHFTTLGYVKVANTITKLVNEIISDNKDDFKFFSLYN